jgi:hypothetical protein
MYQQAKFATISAPPILLHGKPKQHKNISKGSGRNLPVLVEEVVNHRLGLYHHTKRFNTNQES